MKLARSVRFLWIFCLAAAGANSGPAQAESHEDFICTSGSVETGD